MLGERGQLVGASSQIDEATLRVNFLDKVRGDDWVARAREASRAHDEVIRFFPFWRGKRHFDLAQVTVAGNCQETLRASQYALALMSGR